MGEGGFVCFDRFYYKGDDIDSNYRSMALGDVEILDFEKWTMSRMRLKSVDTEQHIAFIACVDADPPSLIRVDLRSMTVIPEHPWPVEIKPDIVTIDRPLHLIYVGRGVGIAGFQEEGRNLKWLGNKLLNQSFALSLPTRIARYDLERGAETWRFNLEEHDINAVFSFHVLG